MKKYFLPLLAMVLFCVFPVNGHGPRKETIEFTTPGSSVPKGTVDLGIVMTRDDGSTYNLYWAKCNIGASVPEEYGDYYAWGEVESKRYFDSSSYKWFNGSDNSMTKYNTNRNFGIVDNKKELELKDDVAHKKLGAKWRMPTDAEWTSLIEQCTWEWISLNDVEGFEVFGRNGNSIFLPAAGIRGWTSTAGAGSFGFYWSSSLFTGSPDCAREIYFNAVSVYRSKEGRYKGLSVRPVYEE